MPILKKCLLLAALLSIQSQATIIDTAKGKVDIKAPPKRLVVYPIGVIDTLNALGVKILGAPKKRYLNYLEDLNSESVGTLFEPDMEKLNALQPDLIIVGTRSAKKYSAVSRIAPSVDLSMYSGNSYKAGIARMQQLAQVFGKQEKAKQLEDELNHLRDEAKKRIPKDKNIMLLVVIGKNMSLLGSESMMGWLKKELNLNILNDKQVFVEEETKTFDSKPTSGVSLPISFEYIREKNPDWLLVFDRDASIGIKHAMNAKALLDNPLIRQTNAWKDQHIVYLNSANFSIAIGGVQSLKLALEQIIQAFKKD